MDNECEGMVSASETPTELRARIDALLAFLHAETWALENSGEAADAIDALLAENVQLRQLADLFRFNFSPWLIHNAPDLYRSLWGEW